MCSFIITHRRPSAALWTTAHTAQKVSDIAPMEMTISYGLTDGRAT